MRPVSIERRQKRTKSSWWTNRYLAIVADLVIAAGLFFMAYSANVDEIGVTTFHPDETRWLNRSYYIEDVFDPYGSTWQDYYVTRGQPPLGSYAIGIGQWVQGMDLHPNLVWDFFYSNSNWNQIAGAMPDDENLESGRRTSAFIGGLAVAAAYYVARRMTNQLGGATAAFLLAWHGLSIRIGSQSLSDQTLLLTLCLAFLAAFQFMKRPTWPWAIVLGICFGLGGAAKLTPLLLSLAAAGLGGLLLLRWLVYPLSQRERRIDRSMAIKLILQPVFAFAAFVLVFPYLWVDPIRRSWNLYSFRIQEMESQGNWLTKAKVDGTMATFDRINNVNNLGGVQQTTWQITQWINDWTGRQYEMIAELDLLIAAASVPFVLLIAMKYGLRSPQFLVTILLGAETGLIVIGLRSDLYRYYLPLVLIMFICAGVMVGMISGWIGSGVTRLFRRRGKTPISRSHYPRATVLNGRIARFRDVRVRRRGVHSRALLRGAGWRMVPLRRAVKNS
jgi:hypothetical protein